jgi:NADH-quinone oxidoreductase subunit E
MLSEEERREIEVVLKHYDEKRAACVEAMKVVQRHRGWVSNHSIRDIAEFLDMTPAELDSVATFYSFIFRKPAGRHVILICDSVTCWIMGYEDMLAYLTDCLGIGLGETSEDGLFTLLPVSCLGACDHAPAMMIDEDLYCDLDRAKIDQILEQYE